MNLQELGVAMQYRLGIVLLVFNNGMWAPSAPTRTRVPGRTIALEFDNPDFAALVRAYRGHGEVVQSDAEFGPALERALAFAQEHSLPALIEMRYEADGIAPGQTLSGIRAAALAQRAPAAVP